MPPTPTTTNSTPARDRVLSAFRNGLSIADTPGPLDLSVNNRAYPHGGGTQLLAGAGTVPGTLLEPARDLAQRLVRRRFGRSARSADPRPLGSHGTHDRRG